MGEQAPQPRTQRMLCLEEQRERWRQRFGGAHAQGWVRNLRASLLMRDCSTHDALLCLCASRVVDIALPISLVDSAAFVASLVGVAEVGAVSPC